MQDAGVIVADGTDMIAARGIDPTPARNTAVTATGARLTSKTGELISRAHDD
jgi:predicted amidohydrolase YtcJ